ncbi:unnamed protein product, partial [Discosporangium mesarthrocarpum]
GEVLAIKLRADNDFYSQTAHMKKRGLAYTADSLATLPPFLPCPVGEADGSVTVAKTGMGSSAALISSLTGAMLSFFDAVTLPREETPPEGVEHPSPEDPRAASDGSGVGWREGLDLVHNLAQICHAVAQGKIGSGFDVSAAVYGTHTYTRFSPKSIEAPLAVAVTPGGGRGAKGEGGKGEDDSRALETISACVRSGRG